METSYTPDNGALSTYIYMYMYIHVHFEINFRRLRDKPKQFAVINIVHYIQYSIENVKTNTKREREQLYKVEET